MKKMAENEYKNAVNNAKSLDELCDLLNNYDELVSLDEYGEPRINDVIDLTSLPLFGGTDVPNPHNIWSWDKTRILTDNGNEYIIKNREEAD